MRRLTLFLFFLALCAHAAGQQDARECASAAPAAQARAVVTCDADAQTCATWQRFRSQHPFPYQTIAFDSRENEDSMTLIFSEVPPIGSAEEYVQLFKATFQIGDDALQRLRYPVGLDGWLEDWVVTVPVGKGVAVKVSGPDGKPLSLPSDLANRLEFVNAAMFGTRSGFYVEQVAPESTTSLPRPLPDLQVPARSLSALAADRSTSWQDLDGNSQAKTMADVAAGRQPRTYLNANKGLVTLAIPAASDVRDLRAEFRKFALSTDYLVGAVRPKGGALLLMGRSRVEPLHALPPLRFETLEALANNLGQPLGQSYERQRIFAGKIGSGPHVGWDWAPIYLSSQLQDTEFGTLLNIADQQLKSLSECSHVRYASFDYPTPGEFPFGDSTASAWIFKHTYSPSLIFNWNTNGFATAMDTPQGRIVSASGTAALPVSYIVPDDAEARMMRKLLGDSKPAESKENAGADPAVVASNKGSDYFAKRGDPILARVVQNVLLYQILGDAKPFKPVATPATARTRSDVVTALLIAEATPWLQQVLAQPMVVSTSGTGSSMSDLKGAMQKTGLSTPQLAELLATPQMQSQRMLRLKNDIDLKVAGLRQYRDQWMQARDELKDVHAKATAEFTQQCQGIGGAIHEFKQQGRSGLRCRYKSVSGESSASFKNSYQVRLAELEARLDGIEREAKATDLDAQKQVSTFKSLREQSAFADAVGADLRQRAMQTKDLDAVLNKVLQATSQSASRTSIQTPSVVLSKNIAHKTAVGGHNIDAVPWNVQAGTPKSTAAGLRWVGDRPTVVIPTEKLGDSTSVARSLVTGVQKAPATEVPMLDALKLAEAPKGSFLERLSQRDSLPAPDASLMERAKLCACDIYIERMDANTSSIVRLKPPPSAKVVFGDSALVEDLSQAASNKQVLFAGFEPIRANAIGERAMRMSRSGDTDRGDSLLAESVASASRLYARASESVSDLFSLRTRSGLTANVRLGETSSRLRLTEALAQRPVWANASVTTPKALSSARMPLVEVRFPSKKQGDIAHIKVFAHDATGRPIQMNSSLLAKASKDVVDRLASKNAMVNEAVEQFAERIHKDSKDTKSVDFFLAGVGEITVRFKHSEDKASLALAQIEP